MSGRALLAEPASLDRFRHWHEFQRMLTEAEWRRAIDAINAVDSSYIAGEVGSWLRGFTRGEVDAHFESQLRELDLATILSLVATTEAALRREYKRRADRRLKDAVSRELQRHWRQVEENIRLEDLLDVWRDKYDEISEHVTERRALRQAVADFKDILHVRHWLAHGRSWQVQPGRDMTVAHVAEVTETLFDLVC